MKRLIFILILCLSLTAVSCAKKDNPAQTPPPGTGVITPDDPVPPTKPDPDLCANPFTTQGQVVYVNQLARPSGKWVLVKKIGALETEYLNPSPAVLNTLDFQMQQQLLNIISQENWMTMSADYSQLPWKTIAPGPVTIPYQLLCTSDLAQNNSSMQLSLQKDLKIVLPYTLNAQNLLTQLNTSTRMVVKDGAVTKFESLLLSHAANSTFSIGESNNTLAASAYPGTTVWFIRLSDTKFVLRVETQQVTETSIQLSYFHPKTGVTTKNVTVPISTLSIAEGTYVLKN